MIILILILLLNVGLIQAGPFNDEDRDCQNTGKSFFSVHPLKPKYEKTTPERLPPSLF